MGTDYPLEKIFQTVKSFGQVLSTKGQKSSSDVVFMAPECYGVEHHGSDWLLDCPVAC